jgi:Beta-galactosidase second all-beta domain
MKNLAIIISFLIILFFGITRAAKPGGNNIFFDNWERVVNLEKDWAFSIGDNPNWAKPDFYDKNWDKIKVPSAWENEGYNGYNGYAWYRTEFNFPKELYGKIAYLYLGYVDDVDQTFLNGHMIGSTGSFPPKYETAYNIYRKYVIPPELLNKNSPNIIAVRVYDAELEGGILRGEIGIYTSADYLAANIHLEGYWKFKTRDSLAWKEPDYNDNNWKQIIVPGYWESQGYKDYDGFVWYRKSVYIPRNLTEKDMVLVMGKIDDFDQTYINGKLVGSTGEFKKDTTDIVLGDAWQEFRGYYIPKNILKPNQINVIAVRVYDGFQDGGIYEGPIGLVTQEKYMEYWKMRKEGKNFIDKLFDKLFNN